jgi:two-component system response regulator FlrC
MVLGESGTGKEVLANYIHRNSNRADAAFVAINCAAIPDTMLESILFGYEKGSFTGAYQSKSGKFEQANGGTLLLDEISEMDISLQAKLLRVLQEQEVERIGGKEAIHLDVRIIATSNRDLEKEVAEGRFREDLYYRLNVFPIKWRPLRERPQDIVPLAMRFIKRHKMGSGSVALDKSAKEYLMEQTWPGNVRELENIIQRAVILRKGNLITSDDFFYEDDGFVTSSMDSNNVGLSGCKTDCESNSGSGEDSVLNKDLKRREYQMIVDTLKSVGGHRNKTADILGISPRTLRYKIAKMRDHGFSFDNLVEIS